MNNLPTISEHQLQTLLKNYLEAKGWYVMRLNSGMVKTVNKYGNTHRIRLAEVGTPDLMAFKSWNCSVCIGEGYEEEDCGIKLLFIEVKTPKNPKPTFAQEQKMKELESFGARCIVAHSLEELQELL